MQLGKNCQTYEANFHPYTNNAVIEKNRKSNNVFIYYQMCPECREPVIGIKEL